MMSRARALLIDDDPMHVIGTREMLENELISTSLAESLEAAYARLMEDSFDILLIDITLKLSEDDDSLDDHGGTNLIKKLRSGKLGNKNINVPVILITKQPSSSIDSALRADKNYFGLYSKLRASKIVSTVLETLDSKGK